MEKTVEQRLQEVEGRVNALQEDNRQLRLVLRSVGRLLADEGLLVAADS